MLLKASGYGAADGTDVTYRGEKNWQEIREEEQEKIRKRIRMGKKWEEKNKEKRKDGWEEYDADVSAPCSGEIIEIIENIYLRFKKITSFLKAKLNMPQKYLIFLALDFVWKVFKDTRDMLHWEILTNTV